MKAILLGTGPSEGVPAPLCSCQYCKTNTRTRPSLLIKDDNTNLLFDVTPDVTRQLHNNNINSLDGAFITHFHFDHSNGLRELYNISPSIEDLGGITRQDVDPYIADFLGNQFQIFCSPFTNEKLKNEIAYAMKGSNLQVTITEGNTIDISDFHIRSFITEHSRGYIGFMIDYEDNRLVYNPDHGKIRSDLDFEDVDVLVYDASAILGYEVHGTKNSFLETIDTIDPDEIYFTNVSEHIEQKSTEELRNIIELENAYIVEDNTEIFSTE